MWTVGSLSVRESVVVGTLILDFAVQWVSSEIWRIRRQLRDSVV